MCERISAWPVTQYSVPKKKKKEKWMSLGFTKKRGHRSRIQKGQWLTVFQQIEIPSLLGGISHSFTKGGTFLLA